MPSLAELWKVIIENMESWPKTIQDVILEPSPKKTEWTVEIFLECLPKEWKQLKLAEHIGNCLSLQNDLATKNKYLEEMILYLLDEHVKRFHSNEEAEALKKIVDDKDISKAMKGGKGMGMSIVQQWLDDCLKFIKKSIDKMDQKSNDMMDDKKKKVQDECNLLGYFLPLLKDQIKSKSDEDHIKIELTCNLWYCMFSLLPNVNNEISSLLSAYIVKEKTKKQKGDEVNEQLVLCCLRNCFDFSSTFCDLIIRCCNGDAAWSLLWTELSLCPDYSIDSKWRNLERTNVDKVAEILLNMIKLLLPNDICQNWSPNSPPNLKQLCQLILKTSKDKWKEDKCVAYLIDLRTNFSTTEMINRVSQSLNWTPAVAAIVKKFMNDSIPNLKEHEQWLDEMLVTLAQHWSLQTGKYPDMPALAKTLVSLDCDRDKNGVGLFCHLLQQHGLEPSLASVLKHRLQHKNYVDCDSLWLKDFADFIATKESSSDTMDTVACIRGGYVLCQKKMKVILALIEEKCKRIGNASFSQSCSLFYDQFVNSENIIFDDWLDWIVMEWLPMMKIEKEYLQILQGYHAIRKGGKLEAEKEKNLLLGIGLQMTVIALSRVIPNASMFTATCLAVKSGAVDAIAVCNSLLPASFSPIITRVLQQIETPLSPSNQNNTCKHILQLLFNACFHTDPTFAEICTEHWLHDDDQKNDVPLPKDKGIPFARVMLDHVSKRYGIKKEQVHVLKSSMLPFHTFVQEIGAMLLSKQLELQQLPTSVSSFIRLSYLQTDIIKARTIIRLIELPGDNPNQKNDKSNQLYPILQLQKME
ncbi:hypothetical protein RFI_22208 [Reticulomyxa filosa]|uniref:Uncharacterized protein n=1 Tax=Reticulomyxa filosa TaxID=46433 RepID=X6MMB0_RETFI|nr:hypothetical protein RFI_22208 [Reticulomyxa filosa]|eukprot:ETO15153.1 hypothetical protein RFI_22208 [Reticulomyxa filosa]